SIRRRGYDYSHAGAYFVTIVAQHRAPRFGRIARGRMLLSEAGAMVHSVIADLDSWHPRVHIDVFQVMPDHIHAIVMLRQAPATTLSMGYVTSRKDEPRPTTPTTGYDASRDDEPRPTTPTTGYDASRDDEPRPTTPTTGYDASRDDEPVGAGPR